MSSTRWTHADIVKANLRIQQAIDAPLCPIAPTRERKYHNRTTIFQGQQFDSERECKVWKDFELQRITGTIRAVIRQLSFALPGTRRRIRVDFAIVENDGRLKFYDAKGIVTEAWSLKRQQVRDAYGITIEHI